MKGHTIVAGVQEDTPMMDGSQQLARCGSPQQFYDLLVAAKTTAEDRRYFLEKYLLQYQDQLGTTEVKWLKDAIRALKHPKPMRLVA